ncbi:MAG TPA: porin [Alphaproteobacteria bacterium]|nr:porin [Alphaproteobacteria bacterium]
MKKVLLGTTALVAAGAIGAGQAQAKFDVSVNGNYYAAYGYVDEDTDNRHSQAINEDFEVHFRIMQTLDNGITVGGRVELEGLQSGDQVDERWLFFRGGFGEIRVGDEDDARKLKSYTAPSASAFLFGANSPYFSFFNRDTATTVVGTGATATTVVTGNVVSSNSTTPNLENDSSKIIYFTPTFAGFGLAASYAPDSTQDRTGFGTGPDNNNLENAWSVGADWSGEFGGVTIGAGGGYSAASDEVGNDDPSIWAAGVNVGFAGFTIGGSIAIGDDTNVLGFNGYSVSEATVWDAGITYNFEAVTVGINYSYGEYEDSTDGEDDELTIVNLEGGYALGDGVLLGAFVGYFDYEEGGGTLGADDNTGWQAGIGAGLDF